MSKTKKQIQAAIKACAQTSKKFTAQVQEVLIDIVEHATEHRDVSMATELINTLGGSARKSAIVAWLETYAQFRWNASKKLFQLNKDKAEGYQFDRESLNEVCWADCKPESVQSTLDGETRLESVIKRLEKAIEADEEVKNVEILPFLRTALQDYRKSVLAKDSENPSNPAVHEPKGTETLRKVA